MCAFSVSLSSPKSHGCNKRKMSTFRQIWNTLRLPKPTQRRARSFSQNKHCVMENFLKKKNSKQEQETDFSSPISSTQKCKNA